MADAERKKKILAIENWLSAEANIGLVSAIGSEGWLIFEIAPGVTIDAWRESHAANAQSIMRWIGR